MVKLPWRSEDPEAEQEGPGTDHADAVVVCAFQDGTVAVYEAEIVIDRPGRSSFEDKTVPLDEVTGVDYSEGLTIGYIQIEQHGVPVQSGGLFSDPVTENTLHFGRGQRDCAREARDAILERARG